MSLQSALDFSGKAELVCGDSGGIGYGVAQALVNTGAGVSCQGFYSPGGQSASSCFFIEGGRLMRQITLYVLALSSIIITATAPAQAQDSAGTNQEVIAQAQPVAPAPPPGCGYNESFSDFDFWLGGWNVYARNGAFGGQNFIDKRSNDCLILEQWMSAGGGDGTSLNFLDPRTNQWRQIWVGTNNLIDYSGGLNENGQMILEGKITYFNPKGSLQADFRGTWTELENGNVIQHFQQYDSENEVWVDWFIGTYVPIEEDPNGDNPDKGAKGPAIEEVPTLFGKTQ